MNGTQIKRDNRPEGGVLLSATMYGAWCKALFIAQLAVADGHSVSIEVGEHRSMRGIALQRIEVLS